MRLKGSIAVTAGVAAGLLSCGHASAAPGIVAGPAAATMVTAVAEHCWYSRGVRHCRSFGSRYGYRATRYREYNNPDAYRTGSSHWWEEMDRQDRGGRGRP
jgi:hypothetical protein